MDLQIILDSIAHFIWIAIVIFLFYQCVIVYGAMVIKLIFELSLKDWMIFVAILIATIIIGWATDRMVSIYFPGAK